MRRRCASIAQDVASDPWCKHRHYLHGVDRFSCEPEVWCCSNRIGSSVLQHHRYFDLVSDPFCACSPTCCSEALGTIRVILSLRSSTLPSGRFCCPPWYLPGHVRFVRSQCCRWSVCPSTAPWSTWFL